jgi:hypothetical protein
MDPSCLLQAIAESESAEELMLKVERRYRVALGIVELVERGSFDDLVGSFWMWCRQLWKLYIQVCSLQSQLFVALLSPFLTEGPAGCILAMDQAPNTGFSAPTSIAGVLNCIYFIGRYHGGVSSPAPQVFTLIVARASCISAEDCAALVRFCTQSLKIRHSTLVYISAGRHRGDLAIAFNCESFLLGNLHPSDKTANMVYLLPHLPDSTAGCKWPHILNAGKQTKCQLFHLAFNAASYENVKSYCLPCNVSVEYHEW